MSNVSLASLSLFLATPAQVKVSRERNHAHWGRGLPLDAYLRRADLLDIYEHATDGNLMTWVLAPRDDPHTLEFLCACETFRRKALVLAAASSQPEDTFAYGIAAVFCPSQNRGRGYAKHMMCLLHHVLAVPGLLPPFPSEWGASPSPPPGAANARFSALWSDIGPTYYTTCGPAPGHPGWMIRDPYATIWSLDSCSIPDETQIQWLSENDCHTLWEEDAQHVSEQLHDRPPSSAARTRCTFLPNHGLAAYQGRRSRFFLPGTPSAPLPRTWGVRLPASGAYATYITDIRPRPLALLVTRVRANATEFPVLLAALKHAARENGTESVEMWNLAPELLEAAKTLGGSTKLHENHLNALAWYGPEDPKDVEWIFNEYFCWC